MLDDTRPPRTGQDPPAVRRNLRLVHPKAPQPQGNPSKPRGRHHPGSTFTADEEARIRAALKHARALFGTWACLADAMHLAPSTPFDVARSRERVSGDIAVRLARALGKPLETLLRAPTDAARCPTCGAARGAP